MRPDEIALWDDLRSPAFRLGERRGLWSFKGIAFPFALFFVAAPPRAQGPCGFLLRSDFSSYPTQAPTSQLWHGGQNQPLAEVNRPLNKAGGVLEAFKNWNNCLYHPIDRIARDHNNWPQQFPEKLWTPESEITFLLETVHDLLNDSSYLGADLPTEALIVPSSFMGHAFARAS